MSDFRLDFTATAEDIDELGHVNNARWVAWLERLSVAHWEAMTDAATQARWFWVIRRHEIDYRGNIGVGKTADGVTWVDPAGPQGATWDRLARFTSDGRTCVEARTTWAVIDRTRGRPVRVPGELVAVFGG